MNKQKIINEETSREKKIGIMQPYFFPYIGYWQLMNAVDLYVVYDDVDYIKGGWINRNRILINGEPKYINLPIIGASSNKKINQTQVDLSEFRMQKVKSAIRIAYGKAPFYNEVYPIIEQVFSCEEWVLSLWLLHSFNILNDYLGIDTPLVLSSTIKKDNALKGQDKVLNICQNLGATKYYNAIGGKELYSGKDFEEKGITLKFLKTEDIIYKQFRDSFVPSLSIIDVMMFNSKDMIREMFEKYNLV